MMMLYMSSSDVAEWIAYNRIEPFGEERADLRAGMIASPLINIQLKKGATPTKPSQWLLDTGPPEDMDPEDMKQVLKSYTASRRARREKAEKKPKPVGRYTKRNAATSSERPHST